VANGHQVQNARQLQKAGGAVMLLEKDCTGEMLFDLVSSLLEDKDRLLRMSYAQRSLAAQDAAGKIVEMVLALVSPD
jgi:UDP-N-acetylglucosamine--N-acetylmuramyl-(pentapeptide) pyrophosphoryl-undecaprenol N-acetylglucosamine transferase